MHQCPKDEVVRQKWVKFVQRHRLSFKNPSKYSSLCSAHFDDTCYFRPQTDSTGASWRWNSITGSVPTLDSIHLPSPKKTSSRSKHLENRPKFSIVSCRPEFDLVILAIFNLKAGHQITNKSFITHVTANRVIFGLHAQYLPHAEHPCSSKLMGCLLNL